MAALDERAWRGLAKLGVDLDRLRRCFEELCREQRRPTKLGSVEIESLKKLLFLAERGQPPT